MWRGLTFRETVGAGLLLSTPLTLLVVIARLGLEVKVIDDRTAGAIVLLAIGTSIILPWIFRALMKPRS